MTQKLNQIIAIEKGVKSRVQAVIDEIYKAIQKAPLFEGLERKYQPKDDEGDKLPGERKVVQARVADLLGTVRIAETELMNVTAQKEQANTLASAPVIVDGKTVLGPTPVTTLLFLEKRLTDWRTLVSKLPELDISEVWQFDADAGIYKTEPVQTHRTVKTQRPIVLYDATDKHPAQTQLITSDEIAGFWHTTRQSGAVPKSRKAELLERADKLLIAVKQAREAANALEAADRVNVGGQIFEFLLTT
jgi:hypothetical protein